MPGSTYKVVIMLGNSQTGKTCLLTKLTKNKIEAKYRETFGCDFTNYELNQLDQKVNLSIWDAYGEEDKIPILPNKLYKQAKAFIIVCSYSDRSSLDDVGKWTNHIKSYTGLDSNIPILLLLNKFDLSNKSFSSDEAMEVARTYDIPHFYNSSIYGNVSTIFSKLSELLLGRSFPFRKSSVVSETTRISLMKASTNNQTKHPSFREVEIPFEEDSTTNNKTNRITKKRCFESIIIEEESKEVKDKDKYDYTNSKGIIRDSNKSDVPKVAKSSCCF